MKKKDIDRFFEESSKRINTPVQVFITGGIASWFMGGNRPTEDIDFGLRSSKKDWHEIETAFQETSQRLKLPIQFTEDLSRWSMISIPDYEKKAEFHKKFGSIEVYFLDPLSWSIGKICRYYPSDIEDLKIVFKKKKLKIEEVLKTWAKALKLSPKSSQQFLFIKTTEDFIREYGPEVWGKSFDTEKCLEFFRKKLKE